MSGEKVMEKLELIEQIKNLELKILEEKLKLAELIYQGISDYSPFNENEGDIKKLRALIEVDEAMLNCMVFRKEREENK